MHTVCYPYGITEMTEGFPSRLNAFFIRWYFLFWRWRGRGRETTPPRASPGNGEAPPLNTPGPRHAATAPSQLMHQRRGTTEGPNCLATSSQVPLMNPVALGILLQVQCVGWSAQSARGAVGLPLDPPMPPAPGPGLERIRPTPRISIGKVRSAPIPSLCCTAFLQ